MGKAKKRSFSLGINDRFSSLTREQAVAESVNLLENYNSDAINLITLFGLTEEELLEGGASYENVKNIQRLLK